MKTELKNTIEEQIKTQTNARFTRLNSENYALNKRIESVEKLLEDTLAKLKDRNREFKPGEISGDKIKGGKIQKFRSQGIVDDAKKTRLTVQDDQVQVEGKLKIVGELDCAMLYYSQARCEDLDVKNSIRIDKNEVVWKDKLGNSIKKSKLTEVGVLKELNVADTFIATPNKVGVNTDNPTGVFGVVSKGIEVTTDVRGDTGFIGTVTSSPFAIGTSNDPTLFVSHDNKIGIKVKKPKADLDVAGHIRYQGQTHQYLDSPPTAGNWSKGDITWNTDPRAGSVLGWVCVKSGSPGAWKSFAPIS